MNNPTDTSQKVAVITGGASGIGKATAIRLASKGIHIVIAGRSSERGEATVKEIEAAGGKAIYVSTDVSSEKDIKNLVDTTVQTFGHIDLLFNNAGIEGTDDIVDVVTAESIDQVLGINIKGVLLGIKHVLPVMEKQGGGMIINNGSFVGTTLPVPYALVYGASKAAVLSITRAVALGFADKNIDVYAVCPWITDTPMADRMTGHQHDVKSGHASTTNPSGKIATPEDLAGAVTDLFLENPAGLKSGDAILVDSGGELSKITVMEVEPLTKNAVL